MTPETTQTQKPQTTEESSYNIATEPHQTGKSCPIRRHTPGGWEQTCDNACGYYDDAVGKCCKVSLAQALRMVAESLDGVGYSIQEDTKRG